MKLKEIYQLAVKAGISHDRRDKKEIARLLSEEKETYNKLKGIEKEVYDLERLNNPYPDSRILYGDPNMEIQTIIAGIDMEVGEILLTHLLNKDQKNRIDLIIAHHPEGYALAQLYDVMKLQTDYLTLQGVNISVAEKIMEKRISEVERRLLPVNHSRAVSVAKLLNLPLMCLHTPADNCVSGFLTGLFRRKKPYRLGDLIKILLEIPEYKISARGQAPPKIVNGGESSRCGEIYVDMTGGTQGSKEIYQKFADSGVGTLVGMHFGEDHLENAKKAKLNVVIAGHISSDTLGLNLLFDEIEKVQPLNITGISGFERIRQSQRD